MSNAEMDAHLASAATTLCRAWTVMRRDGVVLGFTDHDRDLTFDGVTHRAGSGLTARALQQSTGLSVDNSEALGACLLYTSDAADDLLCVDPGGRRILKTKNKTSTNKHIN